MWITQTEENLIPLLDPTIKTVVEFLNTQTVFPFSASATELSDLIFSQTQNKISNVTLSKKLIGHPTQLESLGYSCITARNKNGRTLRITKIEE